MADEEDGTPTERLCRKVREAEEMCFRPGEDNRIAGEVIQRLALHLPLAPLSSPPLPDGDSRCSVTAFGIRIVGAVVDGRILLDKATPPGGGSVCPIEFEDCELIGGFSGAHARFSRLGFRHCRFRDPEPDEISPHELMHEERSPPEADSPPAGGDERKWRHLPSIELAGADIAADLDIVGSRAVDDVAGGEDAIGSPPAARQHFWLRLAGARVDGNLNLSRARLRAPREPRQRLLADLPVVALDLSQIDVNGDFLFVSGAMAYGRIAAREAHIRGDLWMSGATLDGRGEEAILLQNATVDGIIVLQGRHDREDMGGAHRRFVAWGQVDCHGLRLGGGFTLEDADLHPSLTYRPSRSAETDAAGHERICLSLKGAVIGGSVFIGGERAVSTLRGILQFEYLEVRNRLVLTDLALGAEKGDDLTIKGHCLAAREIVFRRIEPLGGRDAAGSPRPAVSIDLSVATIGKLEVEDSHFDGCFTAAPIECRGDVRLDARLGGELNLAGAVVGGELDISRLRIDGAASGLVLANGNIGGALRLGWRAADGAAASPPAKSARSAVRCESPPDAPKGGSLYSTFSVAGQVDLSGLASGRLEDGGGRLWGSPARIRMNHFTYRQTSWDDFRDAKPSHARVADWSKSVLAEWLWPFRRGRVARWLRRGGYWEPWQIRRDWIYRQFNLDPMLLASTRRKIHEEEYRSQPFEQAVRVARAEGRDDLAVQFEMLKQRIEWRLFNRRTRWPLAFLAITAACGWLFYESRSLDVLTVAMLVLTFGLMGYISRLKEVVEYFLPRLSPLLSSFRSWLLSWPPASPPAGPRSPPPSRLVKWLLVPFFLLPPGAVYFGRWTADPLPFIVAMSIFVTLRLISAMSHGVMRFLFGYLRRPVRAVCTLVGAFLIGWIGIATANAVGMMVIDVEPVAGLVDESGKAVVVGAQRAASADEVASDIACDRKISEPLYALDVLIPLIDLRQESRCEPGLSERAKANLDVDPPPPVRNRGLRGLWEGMPTLTTYNENFWDVLKALYALAGWFIVSLSILTFAHVNRSRVDPA